MEKITIHKSVFWNTGNGLLSGKVKQIMSDHVLVETASGNHLVRKSVLSGKPIGKIASLMKIAMNGVEGLMIEFDGKRAKFTHVDKKTMSGGPPPCKGSDAAVIKAINDIIKKDTRWNSGEILNSDYVQRQRVPVPPVKAPVKQLPIDEEREMGMGEQERAI